MRWNFYFNSYFSSFSCNNFSSNSNFSYRYQIIPSFNFTSIKEITSNFSSHFEFQFTDSQLTLKLHMCSNRSRGQGKTVQRFYPPTLYGETVDYASVTSESKRQKVTLYSFPLTCYIRIIRCRQCSNL